MSRTNLDRFIYNPCCRTLCNQQQLHQSDTDRYNGRPYGQQTRHSFHIQRIQELVRFPLE